ncbi:CMRF35-like molecule 8 isoform X2 [Mugil cephalus]|uniref:CMRF35-like molecule 8 isoform X2 n=1 Tax=Mugil cephalus TaxID=48193 RepID=UPI001FB6FFEA|nr:CMRF35-like molecule 8 isoform X2 [Mugil cephalus]
MCYSQSTSSSGNSECLKPFVQTAYETDKTTIICDPGKQYTSKPLLFFCKDGLTCKDILSRNSDRKFSHIDTKNVFNISICNVSSKDKGVYWCGVISKDEDNKMELKKIQLHVSDIKTLKRSPKAGHDFTYWCSYGKVNGVSSSTKFICKGEDTSTCQRLVNTTKADVNNRISMKDDIAKKNITITMREVTTGDSGTYWCGVETTDSRCSTFINKATVTVVSPTPSSSPVPSTQETTLSTESHVSVQTTTAPAESRGVPNLVIGVIVCGAVLLLVIVWILIYKRFSCSRNPSNAGAEQHYKEDFVYEEIEERFQKPDSQNTINAVYVTVGHPTNDPALLHYSTVHFQNSADETGGEALIHKPTSSACQYSPLKYNNTQTSSTIYQPSTPAQDPLYSTIKKPRQQ